MAENQQLVLSAEAIQAIIQGLANNETLASAIAARVRTDTSTQRGTPKETTTNSDQQSPGTSGRSQNITPPVQTFPQEILYCLLVVMTLLIPQPYVRIRQHSIHHLVSLTQGHGMGSPCPVGRYPKASIYCLPSI